MIRHLTSNASDLLRPAPPETSSLVTRHEAFICAHDQDLLLELEQASGYDALGKYRVLFLGDGEIDKLAARVADGVVVVCRDLPRNIESRPRLLSFTAWYALVENESLRDSTTHVTLLEYDVKVLKRPEIDERVPIQGYVRHRIDKRETSFDYHPVFAEIIRRNGLAADFSDIKERVYGNEFWCCTTNFSFELTTLRNFVRFYYDLWQREQLETTKRSHFVHERMISYFALLHGLRIEYAPGVIEHLMLTKGAKRARYGFKSRKARE